MSKFKTIIEDINSVMGQAEVTNLYYVQDPKDPKQSVNKTLYKDRAKAEAEAKARNLKFDVYTSTPKDYIVHEDVSEAKPEAGKLHKILRIPENETIGKSFKSGEELANALLSKIKDKKEVTEILVNAANVNPKHDIFNKALSAISNIE